MGKAKACARVCVKVCVCVSVCVSVDVFVSLSGNGYLWVCVFLPDVHVSRTCPSVRGYECTRVSLSTCVLVYERVCLGLTYVCRSVACVCLSIRVCPRPCARTDLGHCHVPACAALCVCCVCSRVCLVVCECVHRALPTEAWGAVRLLQATSVVKSPQNLVPGRF